MINVQHWNELAALGACCSDSPTWTRVAVSQHRPVQPRGLAAGSVTQGKARTLRLQPSEHPAVDPPGQPQTGPAALSLEQITRTIAKLSAAGPMPMTCLQKQRQAKPTLGSAHSG